MNLTSIKNILHRAVALSFIVALGGCISPRYFSNKTVDVTNEPAWWGQLAKGEVLRLKQDTLLNDKLITLNAYKITDGYDSSVLFGGTVSVEKYKANPNKFWPELHLLPKDTRVRCVKLERFFSLEHSDYSMSVEILNGEFNGQVVGLSGSFVSGVPDRKGSLILNTSFIEPAQ